MAQSGVGLWVALKNSATICLYHTETFRHLQVHKKTSFLLQYTYVYLFFSFVTHVFNFVSLGYQHCFECVSRSCCPRRFTAAAFHPCDRSHGFQRSSLGGHQCRNCPDCATSTTRGRANHQWACQHQLPRPLRAGHILPEPATQSHL